MLCMGIKTAERRGRWEMSRCGLTTQNRATQHGMEFKRAVVNPVASRANDLDGQIFSLR